MNNKVIISLVVVIAILFIFNSTKKEASTQGSTITRSFQHNPAYANTPINVYLDIDTQGSDTYWSLFETINGFNVNSVTSGYNCDYQANPDYLSCYISSGASDVRLTYQITPGNSNINFNGKYLFETDSIQSNMDGTNLLQITSCPGGTMTCDGEDNDCDYQTDEADELTNAPSCPLTQGVCMGSKQSCSGGSWQTCTSSNYGGNYVSNEDMNRCDGLDNDCDGTIDEPKNTNADIDCSGCVSQQEFNAFIPIFRADPPNQQVEFNQVVSVWRSNPACP